MATVTITGSTVRDALAKPDNRPWKLRAATYQDGGSGSVITPGEDYVEVRPVAGKLAFDVEAGIALYIESPDAKRYLVTTPAVDDGLWDVIEAGVTFPPETSQEQLNAAVANAAPALVAAELQAQTADAVDDNLATRAFGLGDDGAGGVVFESNGVPTGGPSFAIPGGTWSTTAGAPSKLAAGVAKDGTTDDRAALATSDTSAVAASLPLMLAPGTYRVASDLTIASPVWFTPGAILNPDSGVTVTLAGGIAASPPSKIFDHSAGGVVAVKRAMLLPIHWWGAVGDGVTDDTAAVVAAFTSAVKAGGGTVCVPAAHFRCDGQVQIPTDGGVLPRMGNIRFIGVGFHSSGQDGATTPTEGSILDLRYNGDPGQAKILTTGFGSLEMTGLTLTDNDGSGTSPFFKTTNTTVHAHGNGVIGSPDRHRTTCDQDAFILGGTNTPSAPDYDTTDNGPFQGYGTVIEKNYFGRIRRGVLGQTYANANVVQNNNFWNTCGSNLTDGCAIEFIGDVASEASGNYITGNLIEMPGYKYGIQLTRAHQNIIIGNGCYDPEPTHSVAAVHLGTDATWNLVIDGFTNQGLGQVVDDTGNNTHIGVDDSIESLLRNPVAFRRLVSLVGAEALMRWYDDDGTTLVAGFSNFGRTWESLVGGGTGGEMTWNTGTGGNYASVRAYRLRTKRYDTGAPAIGLAVEQPSDASLSNGECGVYWDATAGALEFRGKKGDGTVVQGTALNSLTGSAALNFGSVAAQSFADLTITVTGAVAGDSVALGVPIEAVTGGIVYSAWVSASNTVTVRAHNYSAGALDPASGTFKAAIVR